MAEDCRSDLESLGYMLIYFLRGELHWSDESRAKDILEQKEATSISDLREDLLELFTQYVRTLEFDHNPDYRFLRGLFDNLHRMEGFEDSNAFDWIEPFEALKFQGDKD